MIYLKSEIRGALEIAKERLSTGSKSVADQMKTPYICYALPNSDVGNWLRTEVIMKRIAPQSTVATWLTAQGIANTSGKKRQAYRRAWLDELIKELT